MSAKSQVVPGGIAIYQSEDALTVRCPICGAFVFTAFEEGPLTVGGCGGPMGAHTILKAAPLDGRPGAA